MSDQWKYGVRAISSSKRTGFTIMDDRRRQVCQLLPSLNPRDQKETRRIGLLITSSPRLLEALKLLMESGMNERSMLAARAAIKAAENGD